MMNGRSRLYVIERFRTFAALLASVAFLTQIFRQSLSSSRSRLMY